MRVVFMSGGARHLALEYLLNQGVNIVAVITPVPSEKNNRFIDVMHTANKYGVDVYSIGKENVTDTLKGIEYDILLSCGFSYIITQEAINTARIMAINVHPTLLPKYRGYRSGPFIIINGEKKSGVTVHLLTTDMDKGDILKQVTFPVTPFDTTKSVFRKAREMEPELIFEVLKEIEAGTYNLTQQNEADATVFNQIRVPKDSFIDINLPLKDLFNLIRACDPEEYPAYFFIEGEKVNIKMWRENKNSNESDLI